MRLRWLAGAMEDRERIVDFIAQHNLSAALSIDERIDEAAERLREFPNSGRRGRAKHTRELPVTGTPYVLVYQLSENSILLARVIHGAQQWPPSGDS